LTGTAGKAGDRGRGFGVTTWQEIAAAQTLLAKKLREYVAQNNVPALAAVLVRDAGETIVSGQQGIRKVGATGDRNVVQDTDRFNIGSISKVVTAHLIGAMIDAGVAPDKLSWGSTLGQVMPDVFEPIIPFGNSPNLAYKDVTIDQYSVHVSGMPYSPEDSGIYEPASNAAELGNLDEVQRRLAYVRKAVTDPQITQCAIPADSNCQNDGDHHTLANTGIHDPGVAGEAVCARGQCVNYSGGQVINAAMLERLSGRDFDDLMQSYVFGPLGMTRSRFGRTATGADDPCWQHGWDAATLQVVPYADGDNPAYDTHPRNPVGAMCTTAADLGRFLAESIRPDPQLFKPATLNSMQTYIVAPVSAFTRGAWVSEMPGTATANVQYGGDNNFAVAFVRCLRSQQKAVGAMCNMNNQFGDPALSDMQNTAYAFDANWDALFGAGSPEPLECSHQMPALVATGTGDTALTLFARKRDGTLTCRKSTNAGQSWSAEIPIPAEPMTSGLAATAGGFGGSLMFVFGRGTDNQIWCSKSSDGGQNWQNAGAVPFGTFVTGPAVARSTTAGTGVVLHLVGIGTDRHMWYIRSEDGGTTWNQPQAIAQGTFTSAPAIIASDSGNLVQVFARGDDFRLWENSNAGAGWQQHWQPIGQGLFVSGPAATFDGSGVHLFARGTDRAIWHNWASGAGQPFQPHYQPLPNGTFMSAPAAAAVQDIYLAALGDDFTVYVNRSTDGGVTWAGPRQVGPNPGFFI
jgi:CubicO group peptidase (beta-lactamase class C family)